MTSTPYRGYVVTARSSFSAFDITTPDDSFVISCASSLPLALAQIDTWHAGWRATLADPSPLRPEIRDEYRAACFIAIRECGEFE